MQCHIKNVGQATGEACFDVVHICRSGEHTAKVCSGVLTAGSTENKVIILSPPVAMLDTCMGTEFRNKRITGT